MVTKSAQRDLLSKPQILSGLPDAEWQGQRVLSDESRASLIRVAAELERLRVSAGKHSGNSSRPPSTDRPDQKAKANRKRQRKRKGKKRSPGGQKGHPGHQRPLVPPERVDKPIEYLPSECRRCGESFDGTITDREPLHHQVAEIPEIKPEITDHILHRITCASCNTTTTAKLPAGVPSSVFGPNLRALVVLLSGRYRISRREVKNLCDEVFGLSLSVGSVANILKRSSKALKDPFDEVASAVKNAAVAYIDETGWREKGKALYLWILLTASCALFRIGRRTKGMAQEMLGEHFSGSAVTDRYSAYLWLEDELHQVCWSHLIRDFEDLAERGGRAKVIGDGLLKVSKDLFATWHKYKDGHIRWETMQRRMVSVETRMGALLAEGTASSHPAAARLCNSLSKIEFSLFVFARIQGVEPTNNNGERGIRPAVQWRKICFGTQSSGGSLFVERILTVVATCRLQQRPLLSYLRDVFIAADGGQQIPGLLHGTGPPTASATERIKKAG